LAPPRWDQRDRSRQTKPIAPVEGVGRGRPTYEERRANRAKQTQFARRCRVGRGQRGVARGANAQNEPNSWIADRFAAGRLPCGLLPQARAGRTCKTNPIWPGLGGARTPAGERCKTNPIPGGAGWDEAAGAWDEGANAQNEPNLARPGRGRDPTGERCKTNPICSAPPEKAGGGQGRKCCCRRGQSRQTKPIRRRAMWRASAVWKESYDEFDPCIAPGKRSQFPAAPGADGGHRIVQRLRWQGCQTNPIPAHQGGASGRDRPRRPAAPFFQAIPNYRLTSFRVVCTFCCFPNVGKVRPCCDCRFGTAPAPCHRRWSAILRVRSTIPVATAVAK
jgi:hypothetical protein